MAPFKPLNRSQAQPPSATNLLAQMLQDTLNASINRQFVPTIISGFLYTILQPEPASWLWTAYGMLLGTAIGLMFDEEADQDFEGPMDRIDHAAMAVATALLIHILIFL